MKVLGHFNHAHAPNESTTPALSARGPRRAALGSASVWCRVSTWSPDMTLNGFFCFIFLFLQRGSVPPSSIH